MSKLILLLLNAKCVLSKLHIKQLIQIVLFLLDHADDLDDLLEFLLDQLRNKDEQYK